MVRTIAGCFSCLMLGCASPMAGPSGSVDGEALDESLDEVFDARDSGASDEIVAEETLDNADETSVDGLLAPLPEEPAEEPETQADRLDEREADDTRVDLIVDEAADSGEDLADALVEALEESLTFPAEVLEPTPLSVFRGDTPDSPTYVIDLTLPRLRPESVSSEPFNGLIGLDGSIVLARRSVDAVTRSSRELAQFDVQVPSQGTLFVLAELSTELTCDSDCTARLFLCADGFRDEGTCDDATMGMAFNSLGDAFLGRETRSALLRMAVARRVSAGDHAFFVDASLNGAVQLRLRGSGSSITAFFVPDRVFDPSVIESH